MIKKLFFCLLLAPAVLAGCNKLEQIPQATASREAVFGSEKGLELYANSFYTVLPSANNIHTADAMSDYAARRDAPQFIRPGAYSSNVSDNTSASAYNVVALGPDFHWGWGALRNINYFIAHNTDPKVPVEIRQHYTGLARFFRAFFYFEKVKRYGDVPWINKPLDVSDTTELYKGRDSRVLVMDSVLADLDFAIQHIRTTSDPSFTQITRWVAYAFKSRVCLFEGTFRKYHTGQNLTGTAAAWLTQSAAAAKEVMDRGGYRLYEALGVDKSYRAVFTSNTPVPEVLLAARMDAALGVLHAANWYYTSATTGVRFSFIRSFINTYLNVDGTPFTNRTNYQTLEFKDEVKGRDRRLEQTIRMGSYKRMDKGNLVPAPPAFTYTYTGYQPIKWSLDDTGIDQGSLNTNAVSIFRYAEVLLNYAEAKAELGTLTDAEWAATIGALRKRAGITGGLTAKPVTADPYLQSVYFPNISDPALLEIRRERGIELAMEGFRFYDIVRWRRGELMEMEWNGIYVPALDVPLDLNEDGTPDVVFHKAPPPSGIPSTVTRINVSPTINGLPNSQRLKNDNSGEVIWLGNIPRKWEEKNYFYPIPEPDRTANPKLGQNPGW